MEKRSFQLFDQVFEARVPQLAGRRDPTARDLRLQIRPNPDGALCLYLRHRALRRHDRVELRAEHRGNLIAEAGADVADGCQLAAVDPRQLQVRQCAADGP